MIDFTIQKEGLAHNIAKARENGILIPTIRQMQHPETIPEKVQAKLKKVGMGDEMCIRDRSKPRCPFPERPARQKVHRWSQRAGQ